ncbi:MAG: DNA double-strand break repair nuclease NurA [Dehalococcoidia bacterium]|nr:DNA double-strand break repair nuclease NurA [Dehalococcoidia bacterium]
MPLDFSQLASQIEAYVPRFTREADAATTEAARLRDLMAALGDGWHTAPEDRAALMGDPAVTHPAPACPASYRVFATDGSQIAVDRHQVATCYVINVGTVMIQYGADPDAQLGSVAHLLPDHDADSADDDNGDPEAPSPSRQTSLELERAAAELSSLRALVEASPPDLFTLALIDNSLVLWSQTMNAEKAIDHDIVQRYVADLAALAGLARTRPFAIAGYLSNPSSPWVADLVRTLQDGKPNGAPHPVVYDRDLFAELADGDRTERFERKARMLELPEYPSECWVDFCYLRAGGEIARVEVPRWVSGDPELLDLTHAVILDQCRRNQGNPAYPVALMEAHEQAVVSDSDRRGFWWLLTDRLEATGVAGSVSAKSRTKRTPWT